MTYLVLFLAAFAAATLLPAQSEALFAALLLRGDGSPLLLLAAASVGNISGSVVNWALGRGLDGFKDRRWFPVSADALEKAARRYRSYGRWSLLLCWLPVIGDPITVVAGVLREPIWSFVAIVTVAKVGRYIAVMATVSGWT